MSTAVLSNQSEKSKSNLTLNIDTIACSLLVILHITLPLDLGVPGINLGKTLSSSIAFTLFTFIAVWFTSRGALFQGFRRPFAAVFTVFSLILTFESLQAPQPFLAFSHVLRMYLVFVLNYVIFVHVIEKHGYRWMVKAVLFGASYAATVAIAEVTFGKLPLYQKFAEAAAVSGADTFSPIALGVDFFRANGTMGNAIFMSVLMGICIPFVFELKSPILRILMVTLFLAGAAATISRTIAFALIVLLVGCAFVYTRAFWRTLGTIFALFLVTIVVFGSYLQDEPHVAVWEERLGLKPSSGDGADANVVLRANNSKKIIRAITEDSNPIQVLLGHGYFTSGSVALLDDGGPGTADDTPVTIAYEEGILGLLIFYGSFIAYAIDGKRYRKVTIHWYNGLALLACGFGTDFEAYSMFNIIGVCSIAIVTARTIGAERRKSLLFREVDSIPIGSNPEHSLESETNSSSV